MLVSRRKFLLHSSLAALSPLVAQESIESFALPPKSVFDPAMPRYPNLWFLIDLSLAGSYEQAVKKITEAIRTTLHLPEYYPPFDNPEGCDYEVHLEHLQPWIDRAQRNLQHGHSFHMRYYHRALAGAKLNKIKLGGREFYRFAASVHYEVEHANPNHADVESCPFCGRTGEYANAKGNLVESVHDPLGLELALHGTIRKQVVHCEDWQHSAFGGLPLLKQSFRLETHEFPVGDRGRNTARIGVVIFRPLR